MNTMPKIVEDFFTKSELRKLRKAVAQNCVHGLSFVNGNLCRKNTDGESEVISFSRLKEEQPEHGLFRALLSEEVRESRQPIATFYVAWNGETTRSFFKVFASHEEAKGMVWNDRMYRGGRVRSPHVREWKIGVTDAGDPFVLEPAYRGRFSSERGLVALVPYRGSGEPAGNVLMQVGVPIAQKSGQSYDARVQNLARRALLEYYEKFVKVVTV